MGGLPLKNNNKGFALVLVLMVLCVFVILGTAYTTIVLSENKNTTINEKDDQAYYLARSGVAAVSNYIISHPDSVQSLIDNSPSAPIPLGNGYFTVTVAKSTDGSGDLTVTSDGVIPHIIPGPSGIGTPSPIPILSARDVSSGAELILKYSSSNNNWVQPSYDVAVFSLGTISLSGSANFIGSAGTNSAIAGAVSIDNSGSKINGDLLVGPGGSTTVVNRPNCITGSISSQAASRTFPLPDFPIFPSDLTARGNLNIGSSQTISSDGYYTEITVGSGATLTFDVGSGIRKIKVDNLKVGYQGILITGTGTLVLYVSTSMSFGSGTSVNPANPSVHPEKMVIYYSGTNAVSFSSGSVVATLYASQASNITITGGTSFTGNVISGGPLLTLDGGTSSFVHAIIAPKANVNMSGGASLTGAIISKNFTASGSSRVTNNTNIIFPTTIIQGSSVATESYEKGNWR